MDMLICPVCGKPLFVREKSYVCEKRHCFDISAKGYVNLLLADRKNSKIPGDNKLMVNARRDFLNKGFYDILADKISETAVKYCANDDFLLIDAGCGEGYYTHRTAAALSAAGHTGNIIAADISKFACAAAAGRFRAEHPQGINTVTAAASVFRLPAAGSSADMLMTIFAPFCREEFHRVLKSGGIMIMVIPSAEHLYELKQAVYDEPYMNHPDDTFVEGFELTETIHIRDNIEINGNETIKALFSMTPYYYKTGEDGHKRLDSLERLRTRIGFEILVYKRK